MSEEDKLKAKLALKIVKLSKDIGGLEKDGENLFSHYKYISSDQMLAILREHLVGAGFAIIPSVVGWEEIPSVNEKGKQVIRTVVNMSFDIVDTETGYTMQSNWVGADQDTGGKSLGQAATEGDKRFKFKLLNVSAAGDKDPDNKTTEATETEEEKKDREKKTEAEEKLAALEELKKIQKSAKVTLVKWLKDTTLTEEQKSIVVYNYLEEVAGTKLFIELTKEKAIEVSSGKEAKGKLMVKAEEFIASVIGNNPEGQWPKMEGIKDA